MIKTEPLYSLEHNGRTYEVFKDDDFGYFGACDGETICWQITERDAVRFVEERAGIRPYKPEWNI